MGSNGADGSLTTTDLNPARVISCPKIPYPAVRGGTRGVGRLSLPRGNAVSITNGIAFGEAIPTDSLGHDTVGERREPMGAYGAGANC
jgi:hypothetical protein